MEIILNNVGKRFGTKWLFRNINFELKKGEIYAITGANGSGKSTLLKMLAAQLAKSEGTIEWKSNGVNLEKDTIAPQLSLAAPYVKLIEDFTLAETISFHTKFKPFRKPMSIEEFSSKIQLMSEVHHPLNQFSMGMMQRVKLGLAMLSKSPLVLLDEPTSNLDNNGKEWFFSLLEEISANTLVVLASNEKAEIHCANYILNIG